MYRGGKQEWAKAVSFSGLFLNTRLKEKLSRLVSNLGTNSNVGANKWKSFGPDE